MTAVAGMILAAMGQQVETVAVAQPNVGQHEIVRLAIDGRQPFGQAGRGVGGIALVAEPVGHRDQHLAVVVNQQKRSLLFHSFTLSLPADCGLFRIAPVVAIGGGCRWQRRPCCRQISTSQGGESQRPGKREGRSPKLEIRRQEPMRRRRLAIRISAFGFCHFSHLPLRLGHEIITLIPLDRGG